MLHDRAELRWLHEAVRHLILRQIHFESRRTGRDAIDPNRSSRMFAYDGLWPMA